MLYVSTRGKTDMVSSAHAIASGLAADGGLFMPLEFSALSMTEICAMQDLPYGDRAVTVLSKFLTDFSEAELQECVTKAYSKEKFGGFPVPLHPVKENAAVLELWHGPTSAFKDMALQILPLLLTKAVVKTGESKKLVILVATSGDTGKAALEGFRDVEQIKIQVFYPEGGVSSIQRLQMVTQQGGNVSVVAVQGNFDDAQSGVKAIFGDKAFHASLAAEGVKLSSANSINWGRLVPQIVYYFSAYADLLQADKIQMGEKINFTVPTGNFGDILAGYYAKCMGLPVHKLICASNANNVLTDFLRTGVYDRQRDFYKTLSPSMDILISSNLERLLYHMTQDADRVRSWMAELAASGRYAVDAAVLDRIQQIFWADWADDKATAAEIKKVYEEKKYVLDTHTSVAWKVAENYQKQTSDQHRMVIVSTASPYKFNESVLQALSVTADGLDAFGLLDKLEDYNTNKAPKGLASLRTAPVLHTQVCERGQMKDMVAAFAEGGCGRPSKGK